MTGINARVISGELSGSASISYESGRAMTFDGTKLIYASSSFDIPAGPSLSSGDGGDYIDVAGPGSDSVLCDCSGSITIGAPVTPSGSLGKFIAIADLNAHVGWVWGQANSAASGGKVRIVCNPQYLSGSGA